MVEFIQEYKSSGLIDHCHRNYYENFPNLGMELK